MPTPNPYPTAAQIVKVAEIMMISTNAAETAIAADATAAISNAKWALTLSDIALWDGGIRDGTSDVKKVGVIEFFENTAGDARIDFRNHLRVRYGYPVLFYEGEGQAAALVSTLQWF